MSPAAIAGRAVLFVLAMQTALRTGVACAVESEAIEPAVAEHPADEILARRVRLQEQAHWAYQRGRLTSARDLQTQVVNLSQSQFGADDPRVADDLVELADTLMDLHDYEKAAALTKTVLSIRRSRQKDRPWLERDMVNRLAYLERVGRMTEDEHRKLREASAMFIQGERLSDQGQQENAILTTDQGVRLRRETLGFDDRYGLEYLAINGSRRMQMNQRKRAREILTDALERLRKLHGETHRQIAATTWALSGTYRGSDDAKCEELAGRAAEMYDRVLGPDHSITRRTWETLATVRESLAKEHIEDGHEATSTLFGKAATAWARSFGPKHWRVQEARLRRDFHARLARLDEADLAQVAKAFGDQAKAARFARDGRTAAALKVYESMDDTVRMRIGARNPLSLSVAERRADLMRAESGLDAAWDGYVAAVRLQIDALGPDHPDVRALVGRLTKAADDAAGEHAGDDDFDAAVEWQSRAVEVQKLVDDSTHWKVREIAGKRERLKALGRRTARQRERFAETFGQMERAFELTRSLKYDEALPLMENALEIRERTIGVESREVAYCMNAMGHAFLEMRRYREAEVTLEKARLVRERVLGPEHPETAESWHNLGTLYDRIQDFDRSADCYEQAARIRKTSLGANDPVYATTLTGLGTIHIRRGDGVASENVLKEAVGVLRQNTREPTSDLANAINSLAEAYKRNGAGPLAEELYEEASKMWEKLDRKDLYAISLDNRATLLESRGELDEALTLRKEAVASFLKLHGDAHPTTAIGFANLSQLHLRRNETNEAEEFQRRALDAWFDDFRRSALVKSEEQLLDTFGDMRDALNGWIDLARNRKRPDREVWEQVLRWKGFVTRRQRQVRAASSRPELKPLLDERTSLTRRLSRLVSLPAEANGPSWRAAVEEVRSQKERIERQIAREAPGPVAEETAAEVLKAIPDGAVLVDYFVSIRRERVEDDAPRWMGSTEIVAFVATKSGTVTRFDLGDAEEIERLILDWRTQLQRGASNAELDEIGRKLRKRIWTPLEPAVGEASLVLLSPDGTLSQFPFAALPHPTRQGYLIESVATVTIPVPQSLLELTKPRVGALPLQNPKIPPALLLVGDVDYGASSSVRSLRRLPGAAQEIDDVARVYATAFGKEPSAPLRGVAATESAFFSQAPDATVILLATHGFQAAMRIPSEFSAYDRTSRGLNHGKPAIPPSSEDPFAPLTRRSLLPGSQSVVALSLANVIASETDAKTIEDGLLSAVEAAELNLDRSELVVLSACESGLGQIAPGEGVLGLQRAFHLAGARSTVTTLWRVDDDATRVLTSNLFENLWNRSEGDRLSRVESLRQAQLAVMRRYDPAAQKLLERTTENVGIAPIRLWAGVVMSGDWR